MKTIRHTVTLFYCDGTQVFEARDAIGGHYVAVMVDSRTGHDQYLVVGVAPERLRQFRSGQIDLRSILREGGATEWYLANAEVGLDEALPLIPQSTPLGESGLLPDPGFLLRALSPAETGAIKEHESIVLTADLPGARLEAGDVGRVVRIQREGAAYEVEFSTLAGETVVVATVQAAQLRPVTPRDLAHVRELAAA